MGQTKWCVYVLLGTFLFSIVILGLFTARQMSVINYDLFSLHQYLNINTTAFHQNNIGLLGTASETTLQDSPPHRKNILFIVSDDLRPQLNFYKGPYSPNPFSSFQMLTPNLERLADTSIVFTRAYNQFSVCGPSRSSYMTSRRPDTTKVWNLSVFWREAGGNFTTIPQYFMEHGYTSAGLGKIYHPGKCGGYNDPLSWSEPYFYPKHARTYQRNDGYCCRPVSKANRTTKPLPDEDITKEVINQLQKYAPSALSGEKPFFMAVGYLKPHVPYACPQEAFDLYPPESIEIANNSYFPKNFPRLAWMAPEHGLSKDMIQYNCTPEATTPCMLPNDAARVIRRAYFACVSYIDKEVGKLLEELTRLQLDKSTIILFVGDHGYHLGENGLFGKHSNYEQATHSPLLIRIPGLTDQGIISNSVVELLDIFPTLVEASGLADPLPPCPINSSQVRACTEGVSLMSLVHNPHEEIKHGAISQMVRRRAMGYAVRKSQYRYVEWLHVNSSGGVVGTMDKDNLWGTLHAAELYDHAVDLEENVNVVEVEAYAERRQMLRQLLHERVPLSQVIDDFLKYFSYFV